MKRKAFQLNANLLEAQEKKAFFHSKQIAVRIRKINLMLNTHTDYFNA